MLLWVLLCFVSCSFAFPHEKERGFHHEETELERIADKIKSNNEHGELSEIIDLLKDSNDKREPQQKKTSQIDQKRANGQSMKINTLRPTYKQLGKIRMNVTASGRREGSEKRKYHGERSFDYQLGKNHVNITAKRRSWVNTRMPTSKEENIGHNKNEGQGKGHGNDQGKGLGQGHAFDHPEKIDPNSENEKILLGMQIDEGNRIHQAKGAHPEKRDKLIGEHYDLHMQVKDTRKRKLHEHKLWPDKEVIYEIDQSVFNNDDVIKIKQAIEVFHTQTCVKWIEKASSDGQYYLKFERQGTSCSSYVGFVAHYAESRSYQAINLGENCMSIATILHEMLHAIGAEHEQSRPDRDEYLTFLSDNLESGAEINFVKSQVPVYHPYDAESVLQYGVRSFSKFGLPVLKFHDWRLEFLADTGDTIEFYDIKDVTDAYSCSAGCAPKDCKNAGYVNFKCECNCPKDLKGDLCEDTVSIGDCGGVINVAAGEEVYIKSPNYPNNYATGLQCTWLVQGVPNNVLRGTLVDFDVSNNNIACYHWLEIRYNLLGQTGPKRCGRTNYEVWDSSKDEYPNKMIIQFDSYVGSDEATAKGFRMKFESIGTGCQDHPCIHGSCYSPLDTDIYTCVCNTGFTGQKCDQMTDSASIGCSAELGEYCMMINDDVNDQYQWVKKSEGSSYDVTGPQRAAQGYVYLLAKGYGYDRKENDRAVMSTEISFPALERCLKFWYSMYTKWDSGMGTLKVYKENSQGVKTILFEKSGNQGEKWIEEKIFIPATQGLKIIFEAIRGNYHDTDIAVDDILLSPGLCDATTTTSTSTMTTSQTTTTPTTTTTPMTTTTPTTTTTSTTTTTPTTTRTTTPTTTTPTTTLTTTTTDSTTTTIDSSVTLKDVSSETTFICDFEPGEQNCIFADITDGSDEFDWTIHEGPTPSSNTGPESAESGNKYIYTEVSSPRVQGDKAILSTGRFILPSSAFCLKFFLHMYGAPGNLSIFVKQRGNNGRIVKTYSGDKGNQWLTEKFDVMHLADAVVSFEAVRGEGWNGDIAVDRVIMQTGTCSSPCGSFPCKNGGSCTNDATSNSYTCQCPPGFDGPDCEPSGPFACDHSPCKNGGSCINIESGSGNDFTCLCTSDFAGKDCSLTDVSSGSTFICDFEAGEQGCVFSDVTGLDDFDWTINEGYTPSDSTGPENAKSGIKYVYAEASTPRGNGDKAILSTEKFLLPPTAFCMLFFMHMNASDGTLSIRVGQRGTPGFIAKTYSGDKGENWLTEKIDVIYQIDTVVAFEYVRSGWKGDIALDRIMLQRGPCSMPCGSFPCQNGGTCENVVAASSNYYHCTCTSGFSGKDCNIIDKRSDLSFTCDFETTEEEDCIFRNVKTVDKFDWTRYTGSTPSGYTGPSSAYKGSYYMYIEASAPRQSTDSAILNTAGFKLAASKYCLEFFFHMYGSPGDLIISIRERDGYYYEELSLFGIYDNVWLETRITLPTYNDPIISIKGVRGNSYKGDIAVDDITLTRGACSSK